MDVQDSRRLTGSNLLFDGPGAALDVAFGAADPASVVAAWRRHLHRLLVVLGWEDAVLAERLWRGGPSGATLAFSAPIDALYAATEVNEWALQAAAAEWGGPAPEELAVAGERLAAQIAAEREPALLALRRAAHEHGVAFIWDDKQVSLGLGRGARIFERGALPANEDVPWSEIHDVPVALVTGTNGKTTTVRLLARLLSAAGQRPGLSSTDGVWVAGERVAAGDYSGPEGARSVLRHPGVDVAVLEVARGGLLRRGLPIERADVGVITNVAEDHLGEWGVFELESLADAKMLIAKAARRLVLNADDPRLVSRAAATGRPLTWFSLAPCAGTDVASLEEDQLVLRESGTRQPILAVADLPIAYGGAARHNIANALGAAAAARHLGVPVVTIAAALAEFHSTPGANPGRLNDFQLGGVRVLVDFAHNPHGVAALAEAIAAMPAQRRLVIVGQAGDRDDGAIRGLARAVWKARPDRVIVKEMETYLRGREKGVIPALIIDELHAAGASDEVIGRADSELAAVEQAFAWSREGDLLLLLCHESRGAVLELCERKKREGWRPGEA
ncbi:MAG: Mur ligase family protein [Thermoanaerobaculia bacterium]|nr:Mur ligase family protein [Thermoanaerobaculia bacterium]